jgi:PrtD family type I secretion system ABC transporter
MRGVERTTAAGAFWAGGGILVTAVVFSFVVNLLLLTPPLYLLLVYDRVISAQSHETLVALTLLAVFLVAIMGVLDFARRRLLARFAAQFQERLEDAMIEGSNARARIHRGRFEDEELYGTRELDEVRGFLHSHSLVAVIDAVWSPIFIVVVFLLHPLLGEVALAGVFGLLVIAVAGWIATSHLSNEASHASRKVGRQYDDYRASRNSLRQMRLTGAIRQRLTETRRASRDMAIRNRDWTGGFSACSRIFRIAMQIIVLAVGAHLVLESQITVGVMIACMILLVRIFQPVQHVLDQGPAILRLGRNWSRIVGTLRQTSLPPSVVGAEGMEARLEADRLVTEATADGAPVLDGVTLRIEPGQIIEIIGDSGAGKTVLAEALQGMQPLASGGVRLDGRAIGRFTSDHLDCLIGYLPERPGFVPGTILENIARMAARPSWEAAMQAAKAAQAHAMIEGLPDGYLTTLDEPGSRLSRGQRHLIALARALYGGPKILLLDAPDSTLQKAFSDHLGAAFEDLRRTGRSAVFLSRDGLEIAADRVFRLRDGTLEQIGGDRGAERRATLRNGPVHILSEGFRQGSK